MWTIYWKRFPVYWVRIVHCMISISHFRHHLDTRTSVFRWFLAYCMRLNDRSALHTSVIKCVLLPSSVWWEPNTEEFAVVLAHRQDVQKSNEWQQQQYTIACKQNVENREKQISKKETTRFVGRLLAAVRHETATVCQLRRKITAIFAENDFSNCFFSTFAALLMDFIHPRNQREKKRSFERKSNSRQNFYLLLIDL